jgi:hypothetical protein
MNDPNKPPGRDDLSEAAKLRREVLKGIPPDEDGRRDAVVRRRAEGAIAAAELAAGEDPPRTSEGDS